MRISPRISISLALVAMQAMGQTAMFFSGNVSASGGGPSNITLIQSVVCTSGASTGSTSCTTTATGSGNLLVYYVHAGDNTSANSVPTSSSGTWSQACTFTTNGRVSIYYMANSPSGITAVATHEAASNHTASVFYEFSGIATASPLDVCSSAELSITSTTPATPTLATTQTDIVIGWTREDSSGSLTTHTAGPQWTAAYAPQASDGNASVVEYYTALNNIQSQNTPDFTIDSHGWRTGAVAFKSAVAGTTPTGNTSVSTYADFENSTNGTTVTGAIAAAGFHGGGCDQVGAGGSDPGVTVSGTLVVSTTGQKGTVLNETTNGVTYAAPDAGTRGYRYDPGNGGATVNCRFNTTSNAVSAGVWWLSPSTFPDTTTHSVVTVSNPGNDFAAIAMPASQSYMVCETQGGDSTGHIAIAGNTWYRLTVQYNAAGTHQCGVYDITGTQVGSTATHAATGNFVATTVQFGNSHGGAGTTGNFAYIDNGIADWVNGAYPLIP